MKSSAVDIRYFPSAFTVRRLINLLAISNPAISSDFLGP